MTKKIGSRDTILILDFGSQYTQLVARRIREARVYSEILPYHCSWEEIQDRRPKGIVLSGGPDSVFDASSAHPDPRVYEFQGPLLGICYGMQLLAHHFGGKVRAAERREYGRSMLKQVNQCALFQNLPSQMEVWMSHGDQIEKVPEGFQVVARTTSTVGAMENALRRVYGLQFHPEVIHTSRGKEILENFLFSVCGCCGDWTPALFVKEAVGRIRAQIGEMKAVCGLSGGIDSTVAALLVQRALGDGLTCIFVDNGLLRKDEFSQILRTFHENLHLKVLAVDAGQRFLNRLEGVEDPEKKRRIIGEEFIRVFEDEARKLGEVGFLVQGTLYPDIIESVSVKGPAAVIKSHHNVGGLPQKMRFRLVEPLRELFKDEVRRVGRELDLPEEIVERHPFPGPGLAVRILGAITPQRLSILREADQIVVEEVKKADLYAKIWQSFAVLLPVRSVGVMGDGRTYENVVAIRAVHSEDGMTADWVCLPYEILGHISNRIVNEVRGVNRVVYDVTSKPPGTIEWE